MSTDLCHDDTTAANFGNTVAERIATAERDAQAALPTLVLLVPCLIAGIWLLVSN